MGTIHIITLVVIHIILEIWIINNICQPNKIILWAQIILSNITSNSDKLPHTKP